MPTGALAHLPRVRLPGAHRRSVPLPDGESVSDADWLRRVAHLLTPELQREYINRMRAVRANCQRWRWRGTYVRVEAMA